MTAKTLIYVPPRSRSGESEKRSAACMMLTYGALQAQYPSSITQCTAGPASHLYSLLVPLHPTPAPLPCTPRGTVTVTTAPATAGSHQSLTTGSAGPSGAGGEQEGHPGHAAWDSERLPPVPAVEQGTVSHNVSQGPRCPGACRSRAETPRAQRRPRPAGWEDRALGPRA